MKTIKYGNLSINAEWAVKLGEEAFIANRLKKYADRPIFANRDVKQRTEWLKQMYALAEAAVGVKPKETNTGNAGSGKK